MSTANVEPQAVETYHLANPLAHLSSEQLADTVSEGASLRGNNK